MRSLLKAFFTIRDPNKGVSAAPAEVSPQPVPAAPSPPPAPAYRDPISAPLEDWLLETDIGKNLARFRNNASIELRLAVDSKLATWNLLILQGSPHLVPSSVRGIMLKASTASDFDSKQLAYAMVQNAIYMTNPTPADVRAFNS